MNEFLAKLALSAIVTLLLKGVFAVVGHSIAWWLAIAISLVVVFGGFLIIIDGDGGFD